MPAGWRDRIIKAIDADPRSDRAISLATGLGENFVNQLRNTDKEPRLDHVLKVIDALDVSVSEIILGVELTREDEDFVRLVKSLTDDERAIYLTALKSPRQPKP